MNRLLFHTALLLVLVQCTHCAAQNLVPNPSFESYNMCPSSTGGVAYSPGYSTFPTVQSWISPNLIGSADYFNSCAPSTDYVSVPTNAFGYQQARTGKAYIGIIAWEGIPQSGGGVANEYSEYIQCKLTQPMKAGTSYCVSFYVNNAVSPATYNYVGIDDLGVNFSGTKQNFPNGKTISMPYSLKNNSGNFLSDTSSWQRVTGIYTATGGEEWLTMGWFDNGGTPAFQPILPANPSPSSRYRCYLFIDDVSVVEMNNNDTVYSVQDTTTCKLDALNILLESSGQLADYTWSNGVTTDRTIVNDTGIYYCVANIGCITYIDTFKIKYEPAPKLDLGGELVDCNNQPITIRANYPNSTYMWSTGDTGDSITVYQSGSYALMLSNICGTQHDTVEVYIQSPTPAPPAADTSICQFAPDVVIDVQGTDITWYVHPLGSFGTKQQPAVIAHAPGKYDLFITQTIGKCESEKSPVKIDVTYTPHEELGDEVVMCDNDLKMIGKEIEGVSYKWNTGSIACCVLPQRDGLYKLATENECGSFVDSLWVMYSSCEECLVFPNAFTPVYGSTNRLFRPIIKCPVDEYSIMIYNRWGNLVYTSDDVHTGWNGRFNYGYADVGAYIYVVKFRAKNKKQEQHLQGTVLLLR